MKRGRQTCVTETVTSSKASGSFTCRRGPRCQTIRNINCYSLVFSSKLALNFHGRVVHRTASVFSQGVKNCLLMTVAPMRVFTVRNKDAHACRTQSPNTCL